MRVAHALMAACLAASAARGASGGDGEFDARDRAGELMVDGPVDFELDANDELDSARPGAGT